MPGAGHDRYHGLDLGPFDQFDESLGGHLGSITCVGSGIEMGGRYGM
jgi:hypothetical protein